VGRLRIGIAQQNYTVGDLEGNAERILEAMRWAEQEGAHLLCFPELALTGYPPEDLALNMDFVQHNLDQLRRLAAESGETVSLVGFIDRDEDCFNAAAALHRGKVVDVYHKSFLPNYGVFDENRYFSPGRRNLVLLVRGVRVGVTICEDIWCPGGPLEEEISYGGAEVAVNLSASPFNRGKQDQRERMVQARAQDGQVVLVYVNAVGAQDELVFDGRSFVYHPDRGVVMRGPAFREALMVLEVDTDCLAARRFLRPIHRYLRQGTPLRPTTVKRLSGHGGRESGGGPCLSMPPMGKQEGESGGGGSAGGPEDPREEVFRALVMGLADYFRKNGFTHALLGLSGGIDSALVAALAVEALGRERVHALFMPSAYTSELSYRCAEKLAANLGIEMFTHPIDEMTEPYHRAMPFLDEGGVAAENLQARIRGNLLMSYSNRYGWLVLATGNKSELSMGYCTLYGDMAGGFALIKDLLKRDVYALASFINQAKGQEVIPREIMERPPSAELKPGQLDSDSLPPYEVLDPILEAYIEQGKRVEEIVAQGYERELVLSVVRRIEASEYKRRQAPIGIRLTPRAFGKDWRMPISNPFIKYLSACATPPSDQGQPL
jgi:NAD+ synthase (glutamine-hydrolysing)